MVTIDSAATIDVSRAVASAVLAFPDVRGLWIRSRGTAFEFWVLSEPTNDLARELALTDVEDIFYERLPRLDLTIHIVNPAHFVPFDLATIIPPDAVRVTAHD